LLGSTPSLLDFHKKAPKVIENLLVRDLKSAVPFNRKVFSDSDIMVTGGLGFICSSLARCLVALGAKLTLVDSLIPEYRGNLFNIHDIRNRVIVDLAGVRDAPTMASLIKGSDFLFNLPGQISHLDSMTDPLVRNLVEGKPIQIFGSNVQIGILANVVGHFQGGLVVLRPDIDGGNR
jgi:hypothetical protein